MKKKALFLLLLLSFPLFSNPKLPCSISKEEVELRKQEERDLQAFRLEALKVFSALSLVLIASIVKIYLERK